MTIEIDVRRSPAKVCWWVCCNGRMVFTADTRKDALIEAEKLRRAYAI